MVKDVDGGVEYGVDFGLGPDETLPTDVEEMTEAQYTVWRFLAVLQGVSDPERMQELSKQSQEKPSGLFVPES